MWKLIGGVALTWGLATWGAGDARADAPYRLARKKARQISEATRVCRELETPGEWDLADRATVLEAIAKDEDVTRTYISLETWREKKGSVRYFYFSSDPLPAPYKGDRILNVKDGFEDIYLDLQEYDELREALKKTRVVSDEVEFEIRRYRAWLALKNGKVFPTGEPLPPEDVGPEPVISKEARKAIEKNQAVMGRAPYDWLKEHVLPTFEGGFRVVCGKASAK